MSEEIRIRRARREDAAELAGMMEAFAVEDGSEPGTFDLEKVLRDGFGPDPALEALIAWRGRRVAGYVLYFPTYNTEVGARGLWMNDLWVDPDLRGGGLGRQLLQALAVLASDSGCRSIWWGVRNANDGARRFYAEIGAKDDDARILELDGSALAKLATEGESGLGERLREG